MRVQMTLFLSILLFFVSQSFAREVKISIPSTQTTLEISNPSAITVNYDITCFKSDGSGNIISQTGETLAPNAKKSYTAAIADSGKCSGGATPAQSATDINGEAFYLCTGTNTFANADNACGDGNSFCMPSVNTCGGFSTFNGSTFWLKTDASSEFRVNSCGTFAAVTGGNSVIITDACTTFGEARPSSTAGTLFGTEERVTSQTHGAVCCASPESASLCRVTINTTDSQAALSSPSFAGGAAF